MYVSYITFTIYIEVEINRNYLKISYTKKFLLTNQIVITSLFIDYYVVKQELAKTFFFLMSRDVK